MNARKIRDWKVAHTTRFLTIVVERFQTEEHLMQEKGYTEFDAHKAEHVKLISVCADLKKKFHSNEADVTDETTSFVKGWLDNHIPKLDRPYAPTLNG